MILLEALSWKSCPILSGPASPGLLTPFALVPMYADTFRLLSRLCFLMTVLLILLSLSLPLYLLVALAVSVILSQCDTLSFSGWPVASTGAEAQLVDFLPSALPFTSLSTEKCLIDAKYGKFSLATTIAHWEMVLLEAPFPGFCFAPPSISMLFLSDEHSLSSPTFICEYSIIYFSFHFTFCTFQYK